MKLETTPTTAELIAQQIIDFMGEYLEGNPLLVQENAVRYAVEKTKIFDKLQVAGENDKRWRTVELNPSNPEYILEIAGMSRNEWRKVGGQ